MRRHWIVASLPVILLLGTALVLGSKRPPRYTATTNLAVGRIFVNNPAGISGVLEATRSLASVYSRAIRASAVQNDTARRLGDGDLTGSYQVSATPIPDSPLIKVSAQASSAGRAVALATAASTALADYVARQGRSDQDRVILSQYRRADRRSREQTEVRRRLERRYEQNRTLQNRAARDDAAAAASTALLRREALRTSYLNIVQGTTSTPAVEVFSRARSATSDRLQMLQIMLFLGLIAGLAGGTALALLRAHRETRPRHGA